MHFKLKVKIPYTHIELSKGNPNLTYHSPWVACSHVLSAHHWSGLEPDNGEGRKGTLLVKLNLESF